MKTGQYPVSFLFALLLALAAGIALALARPPTGSWPVFLLAALFAVSAILLWRGSRCCWLVFLLLFFVLGLCRLQGSMALPANDISQWAGAAMPEVRLRGEILEEPRWTKELQPDGSTVHKVRYLVRVQKVKAMGRDWQPASGRCYLYARSPQEDTSARIGDGIMAMGKVRLLHGYQNPGQIDTRLLLRTDGITALVMAGKAGVSTAPEDGHEFLRSIASLRAHYRSSMEEVMPKADAAAVFAMLFGGYDGIEPELVEDFQATGIVHILSVSGSHISLVAAVIAGLAALLHLPRALSALLVLGAIAFYSVLAGCVPPVIRAAIMGGLAFLALALGRERESRIILLLTGLGMLLCKPLLLFHISFELSYLATAGLIFLAPVICRWLCAHRVPRALAMGLAITTAAQLMTLPVLAWYFGQVSIVALLANLIVVPILELIIVLGLLAGLIAFVLPFLGRFVFAMDSLLLGLSAEVTHVLAQLPHSMIFVPAMTPAGCALYYLLLGSFLLNEKQKTWLCARILPYRRALTALLLILLLSYGSWKIMAPREMAVHFIDVGQGDAALVVTPHGQALMFDTGGTRSGSFDVGAHVDVPYLLHYDIHELAAIFLTHAHEDHAQGCGGILRKMPVGHVYTASEGVDAYARSLGFGDADPLLRKFSAALAGDVFTIDGVRVEVLFAPPKPEHGGTGNEVSNVYRVSYGKASFLFTGDLVKEQEARLLASGQEISSSVLKAGHHGSATSSSEEFLKAVAPQYGVFCVGYENSFGHPKPEIVRRYQDAGIRTLRTDEDGAVVFHTDGRSMRVETYAAKS